MSSEVENCGCPSDGGRMALVARHGVGRALVRLFWCRYCEMGIAVLGDSRLATTRSNYFTVDAKTRTLQLTGSLATQMAIQDLIQRHPDALNRLF